MIYLRKDLVTILLTDPMEFTAYTIIMQDKNTRYVYSLVCSTRPELRDQQFYCEPAERIELYYDECFI